MRGRFLILLLAAAHTFAAEVRFAIIGDYGVDNANQLAVANLVKTNFQPQFVVTVGDNNYLGASRIDDAIGKYYSQFIGNYVGSYGAGASSNRFFPALGNHDWYSGEGYAAHLAYFTLPGNERYYDFVRGPVHIFIVNSDSNEPDGTSATSVQARWLSNRLASSTSPWRIVIAQDPPYSSAESLTYMRWPFEDWGAHMVVSGDAHHYERIMRDGFPYVVNGAGGASLAGFGTPISGSVVRYNGDHGAMRVVATETNLTCEFWSVDGGGTLVDRFVQGVGPKLAITRANRSLILSWPTNNAGGLTLKATTNVAGPWSNAPWPPTLSNGRYTVTVTQVTGRAFFRLAE
jgi:tartrate-resistant acid phosphatase type 5